MITTYEDTEVFLVLSARIPDDSFCDSWRTGLATSSKVIVTNSVHFIPHCSVLQRLGKR